MHGIIFLYLQRFVKQKGGDDGWPRVLREAQRSSKSYSPVNEYPDEEAMALMGAACRVFSMPMTAMLEDFGEFLAPALVQLYANLIHPDWRSLEVIANTEELIHTTVRMRNAGARPPMIECTRTDDDSIQIVYSSPRRLCSLARGIVKGIGKHYGDHLEIEDQACMLRGDPFCALQVTRHHSPESKPDSHTGIPHAEWHPPEPATARPHETHVYEGTDTQPIDPRYPFLSPPHGGDEIGRIIHYSVKSLVGQGGMGIVFHALDTRLERPVALKVLRPHLAADQAVRQRFVREARAMAILRNPQIVTVFDVGIQNDTPYMAMEYLEGEPLDMYGDKPGLVPMGEVLRIAREIVTGLTAAHARGVIHRDIKPHNLWVESGSGNIKILDFGLTRFDTDEQQLTEHGRVLGTPEFMAPEQASGSPVDTRADLFSLGVVLYWLCTRVSPFRSNDVMSTLMSLISTQPAPLSSLNSSVPPALSDLIMSLIEKNPENRPQTSREVAETLARIRP